MNTLIYRKYHDMERNYGGKAPNLIRLVFI